MKGSARALRRPQASAALEAGPTLVGAESSAVAHSMTSPPDGALPVDEERWCASRATTRTVVEGLRVRDDASSRQLDVEAVRATSAMILRGSRKRHRAKGRAPEHPRYGVEMVRVYAEHLESTRRRSTALGNVPNDGDAGP